MRIVAGALVLLVGCASPGQRAVPPRCEFPEDVSLAFAGETTMHELGIPAPGEEREIVFAWVTAVPIRFPGAPDDYRAACLERAGGSYERSAYPGALFKNAEGE